MKESMGGYGVIVTDSRNGRQWFDRGCDRSDGWNFFTDHRDAWARVQKVSALNPDLHARSVHVTLEIEEF